MVFEEYVGHFDYNFLVYQYLLKYYVLTITAIYFLILIWLELKLLSFPRFLNQILVTYSFIKFNKDHLFFWWLMEWINQ